jgi:tRNA U34 2-thiouridine synthase MnmA/TrmU
MLDSTSRTPDNGTRRPHAIALFSGGLDSALAVLLLLRQNVEVTALTFMTAFGCDLSDRSSCGHNPFPAALRFGFRVKLMNLGQDYVDMVRNPRFGHGKNMNPCVDCRIHMLRQARDYMELAGADFIITGEVMGQRPFSQVKAKLVLTAREAGVEGILLRPLSARLLPPTIPEERGWVDRERLMGIRGRSRRPQMELAREFGLEDYPNPASGCLLTDPEYSARLRDLFRFQEFVGVADLNLLRVGRQFRLSPFCKAIVGRDEADNARLQAAAHGGLTTLEVRDAGSPITVVSGSAQEADLHRAAELTARYSDLKREPLVRVTVSREGSESELVVSPAADSVCRSLRIGAADTSALPAYGAE